MIHIYYGYGKGKTCSAVGVGMRAYGAGKDVLLVQFLKDNKSSELKSVPFYVYESPVSLSFNPGEEYKLWVDGAIKYIKSSNADVIILDEFLDIIPSFINLDDATKLVKSLKCEVIITGHKKNDALLSLADYITSFEKIKHPYDSGVKARLGIEY